MYSASPVVPASRLRSLDAMRGVALCGILFVNILRMGGPIAMERPLASPSLANGDWQVWALSELFLTGTMRGLLSMLFGVSLMIFVSGDGSAGRARLYRRRLILLLLLGVVDSTLLLWPGDILIVYALAGFVILPLHPLRWIWPLSMAMTVLALISLWAAFEAVVVAPADTVYTTAMLSREAAARLGSYEQTLGYMSWWTLVATLDPRTWRWVGDAVTMMLVGMVMYKKGLLGEQVDRGAMIGLMVAGYAMGLALRTVDIVLVMTHEGGPTFVSALVDQPGRLAMTLGHLGLFQLLWRRCSGSRVSAYLVRMGRMSLTLYLGQSLIAAWLFSGFGLGLWGRLSWPQLWLAVPAILIGEAVFALLWLKAFNYGPMEWLWRWGTYGKRPAMRP